MRGWRAHARLKERVALVEEVGGADVWDRRSGRDAGGVRSHSSPSTFHADLVPSGTRLGHRLLIRDVMFR